MGQNREESFTQTTKKMNRRIFIADASPISIESNKYQIETIQSGANALKRIQEFSPDLILLDLFLPEIHGIAILQQIKADPHLKSVGVIITSDYAIPQNYHLAIETGAVYFLKKPFTAEHFFKLVDLYFSENLKPEPYLVPQTPTSCYMPQAQDSDCYVRFWGTRGSTSISNHEMMRFGGNTACLEIHSKGESLILDAGTGITEFCKHLPIKQKKYNILLSHTHFDHLIGLPFFTPLHDPSCEINLWAPIRFEHPKETPFTKLFDYPYFPVCVDEIKATTHFQEIQEGTYLDFNGIKIWSHYTFHPGITLCFKIQVGKTTFGYVTDNEFLMGYHGSPQDITRDHLAIQPYLSFIQFLKGCDFLIHEAQFFPKEYLAKVGWGHSSVSNAAVLIRETGVKNWIVIHHDPTHTDEILQKKYQLHQNILKECHIDCNLIFAYDGLIHPL
jgi:CheY-like chemotaxis protein